MYIIYRGTLAVNKVQPVVFTASTQQMQLASYRLGGDEPYGAHTLIHYQGVHSYDCTLF